MKTWELKERFESQDQRYIEVCARYDAAAIEAGTRLEDLKAEQTELLRQEFNSGENLSVAKNKVNGMISIAEKAIVSAEHERAHAYEYRRVASADRITVRDLVLDWSGPYRTAVRENELTPILDRLTAAKEAYYNALLDVKELEAAYDPTFSKLRDMAYNDNRNHPGDHRMPQSIIDNSDIPLISREDLMWIEDRGTLPAGINRVRSDV